MLKGLGFLVVRALPLFLLAAPAWAGSTFFLSVPPNGGQPGQQTTYTDSNYTFSAFLSGNNVEVDVTNFQTNTFLTLEFDPPQGAALSTGVYDDAGSSPFQSPVKPGLSVPGGGGGGCGVTSRFIVREFTKNTGGEPATFAADYELACPDGAPPVRGYIRFNSSIPILVDEPTADAGLDQLVLAGETVALDGSVSEGGNGSITGYHWTQISGPSIAFADDTAATTSFTAPDVGPGGADVVVQLEVDNSLSLSSTDTATIHIANAADPITVLYLQGNSAEPIGNAQSLTLGVLDASFVPQPDGTNVSISINGDVNNRWSLQFAAPNGQTLQIGTYDQAFLNPFQSGSQPGFSITGGALPGCGESIMARFVVLDIQISNGKLVSFAADFQQECPQSPAVLHGRIRYNSTVPVDDPYADVGPQLQDVIQGDTVTLSGTASDPGGSNTITGYQWTQISGPAVTLSDPTGATTTFTAPDVSLGGEPLVFELTITSSDGLTSTEQVTVQVANSADPITALYLQGYDQERAGTVQQLLRPVLDGSFSIATSSNVVTVAFDSGFEDWDVVLAPPTGQQLHTGMYSGAVVAGSQTASAPGMNVAGNLSFCASASGRFNVLQIAFDDANNVTQLAADFVFYCNGSNTPLRGKVRYNSSVTIRTPLVDPGLDQVTYEDFPVQLDGSASTAGYGSIVSYSWSQVLSPGDPVVALSDPTSAKTSFFAPGVPLGGRTLAFQLTVTNSLGLSSTDTMHVTVGNESDPKSVFYYESDPGNAVGQGGNGLALSANAFIGFGPSPVSRPMVEVVSTTNGTGFTGEWDLTFSDGSTQPMKPGIYLASGMLGAPGIQVTKEIGNGFSVCTFPTGLFIVRDSNLGQKPSVPELGVDFVVHCGNDTGVLRGSVRVNSPTPILVNHPVAYAGPDQSLDQAGTVTLDGSTSFTGWTSATYQWRQVSGPRVTLTNGNTAIASFALPEKLLTNGGSALVFQLTVKNSLGLSSTGNVTVTAKEPTTVSLSVQSDAGDPIGGGQSATYGFPGTPVKIQTLLKYGVSAVLPNHGNWTLDFAASKTGLAIGTYANAAYPGGLTGRQPLMDVSTASAKCKTVTGSFTVLDIGYGTGNTLGSLALDFVQHCNGIGPALHGKFRYHSAVP